MLDAEAAGGLTFGSDGSPVTMFCGVGIAGAVVDVKFTPMVKLDL